MVELAQNEQKSYVSSMLEYQFDIKQKSEYEILYVMGYKSTSYGILTHVFVQGIDYILINENLLWLSGGDRPVSPPPHLGFSTIPFWVTYTYEDCPETTIKSSIYPFVKRDGTFMLILEAFGTQIVRYLKKQGELITKRDLRYTTGSEVDLIGDWFNVTRREGETDFVFRKRLLDFSSSLTGGGTKSSISSVLESVTGVVPTILELYENTSYWNQSPIDPSIKYVWSSKTSPPGETSTKKIARFSGYINQPGIFYVIYPLSIINQYGIDVLKDIIDSSKASGVTGYLGYLVDETFTIDDSNWDKQTAVPSGTSNVNDWSVVSGEYKYNDTSSTFEDGLSVVNTTGSDDWDDYQITVFVKESSGTAGQMAGVVVRWDTSTDEFYFFGISSADNKAYIYKWVSSSWTKIEEATVTITTGAKYHIRVAIKGISAIMYVDNVEVINDSTSFTDISTGRPGVAAIANNALSEAYFDDVVVVV